MGMSQSSGSHAFADMAAPQTMQAYTTLSSTTMEREKKTVLIIGSSIAGTVFALQLLTHPILRSKYRPIVFDSAATLPNLSHPKENVSFQPEGQTGAAVAVTKQAMWPLRQLELGPELDEISQNTERISMYRHHSSIPKMARNPACL